MQRALDLDLPLCGPASLPQLGKWSHLTSQGVPGPCALCQVCAQELGRTAIQRLVDVPWLPGARFRLCSGEGREGI